MVEREDEGYVHPSPPNSASRSMGVCVRGVGVDRPCGITHTHIHIYIYIYQYIYTRFPSLSLPHPLTCILQVPRLQRDVPFIHHAQVQILLPKVPARSQRRQESVCLVWLGFSCACVCVEVGVCLLFVCGCGRLGGWVFTPQCRKRGICLVWLGFGVRVGGWVDVCGVDGWIIIIIITTNQSINNESINPPPNHRHHHNTTNKPTNQPTSTKPTRRRPRPCLRLARRLGWGR
jgi:hypothetical protein